MVCIYQGALLASQYNSLSISNPLFKLSSISGYISHVIANLSLFLYLKTITYNIYV